MQIGPVTFTAYHPVITWFDVDVGSGHYRHVPSLSGGDSGQLIGAYLYNPNSPFESADGQRACFVRSTNFGKTWSDKIEELNDARFARVPVDPGADQALQGEVFVLVDQTKGQEIAVIAHRGSDYNAGFVAFRDMAPGKLWRIGRFCWTAENAPMLDEDRLSGPPAPGLKLTYTIDGIEHDCIPFKPVIDGDRLIIPVMFVRGYDVRHRVGFLVRVDGVWSVSGVVPLGVSDITAAWEPTTWQAEDGTWFCQARNNRGRGAPSSDNHFIASSADLITWAGFDDLAEDIHVNRVMKGRFGARWFGVGTSSDHHRNGLALFASPDGNNWVHGIKISNEEDGVDWASYSDVTVAGDWICALFSVKKDKLTAQGTNEIRFVRFKAPEALPVMGSHKNLIENNTGRIPSVSGQRMIIPEEAMGSIPFYGSSATLTVRFRATDYSAEDALAVLGVGNEIDGYVTVELRRHGVSTALFVENGYVAPVPDPTAFRSFEVEFDRTSSQLRLFGRVFAIAGQPRVYLGAVSGKTSGGSHEAKLEFDVRAMSMRRKVVFVPDATHSAAATGTNVIQVDAIRSLDLICFRHYGRQAGVVEQVLEKNPHIKDHAHRLPIGARITLPDISMRDRASQQPRLWD